jgi:hypothetical protein
MAVPHRLDFDNALNPVPRGTELTFLLSAAGSNEIESREQYG